MPAHLSAMSERSAAVAAYSSGIRVIGQTIFLVHYIVSPLRGALTQPLRFVQHTTIDQLHRVFERIALGLAL